MSSNSKKFIELLERINSIFMEVSEKNWSSRIIEVLQEMQRDEVSAANQFLSYNGGMGSLNDLIIHPMNKHKIELAKVEDINDELQELLQSSYDLARSIRKDGY